MGMLACEWTFNQQLNASHGLMPGLAQCSLQSCLLALQQSKLLHHFFEASEGRVLAQAESII